MTFVPPPRPAQPRHPFKQSISLRELLALPREARRYWLYPLVPVKSVVMIYGMEGIGKSRFVMELVYAMASGTKAIKWPADKPAKVLYVDGEMSKEDIEDILIPIPEQETALANIRFLTPDLMDSPVPDIGTDEGRAFIEAAIGDANILILDNLHVLNHTLKLEGGGDDWTPIQNWLRKLRRGGVTVIVVHHTNKWGDQSGTAKKKAMMNGVIGLRRPADYNADTDGTALVVTLEKYRHKRGELTKAFQVVYDAPETTDKLPVPGGRTWTISEKQPDVRWLKVTEMCKAGKDVNEIIAKTGLSQATVYRYLKRGGVEKPKRVAKGANGATAPGPADKAAEEVWA